MDHDEYLSRRDELIRIRAASFDSFDRTILALATGGLALSITFLEKIGKPFDKTTFIFICLTWITYFFVTLFNLASYLIAKWNMDKKINELDGRYKSQLNKSSIEGVNNEPEPPETIFWQHKATNICNNASFICFIVGTFFFVWYICTIQSKNYQDLQLMLQTGGLMADGKQQKLNEGLVEPPRAISRPIANPTTAIEKRGTTEPPQAIARPKPTEISTGPVKKD